MPFRPINRRDCMNDILEREHSNRVATRKVKSTAHVVRSSKKYHMHQPIEMNK